MRPVSAGTEQYKWWLLDRHLDVVSNGQVGGHSLIGALMRLDRQLANLDDRGKPPSNHPYALIVYRGRAIVAVRPATVGIC
jgi:hypothetical protein